MVLSLILGVWAISGLSDIVGADLNQENFENVMDVSLPLTPIGGRDETLYDHSEHNEVVFLDKACARNETYADKLRQKLLLEQRCLLENQALPGIVDGEDYFHFYLQWNTSNAVDCTDGAVIDFMAFCISFIEYEPLLSPAGFFQCRAEDVPSDNGAWFLDDIEGDENDGVYSSPFFNANNLIVYVVDTYTLLDHEHFDHIPDENKEYLGNYNTADGMSHGSHVTGSLVGQKYGVIRDPAVKVKVCNACPGGSCPSSYIEACLIAIRDDLESEQQRNDKVRGVINMSLNGGGCADIYFYVISQILALGGITVVAAGNSNNNACDSSPACLSTVITVGAYDSAHTRSSFSNYGTCVDAWGPGSNIRSSKDVDGQYYDDYGTSMASPIIAGMVGQLLNIDTKLSLDETKAILADDSTSYTISDCQSDQCNAFSIECSDLVDFLGSPLSADAMVASPSGMTWNDARAWCENQELQMVSIHSDADNGVAFEACPGNCWIGLNSIGNDGSHSDAFEWTDGSQRDYTHWKSGQPDDNYGQGNPDEDCACLYAGDQWFDGDCDYPYFHALCYYPELPLVERDDGFVLIERHRDVANGYFSSDVLTSGVENAYDPEANTYSIIGQIDTREYQFDDGRYWLQLIYKYSDGTTDTLHWTQTSWITEATITDADLFGVNDDYESHDGVGFDGLAKSSTSGSYLDGTDQHGYWFHAVASVSAWNGGIPGHEVRPAYSSELWIRKASDNILCDTDSWNEIQGNWAFDSIHCAIENTNGGCGDIVWFGSEDGLTPDPNYDHSVFELTATMEIADGGYDAGLMFRSGESSTMNDEGPTYYIGMYPGTGYVVFGTIDNGWSPKHSAYVPGLAYDTVHTLSIHGSGIVYDVYIDGVAVLTDITRNEFSFGSIGMRTCGAPATYYSLTYSFEDAHDCTAYMSSFPLTQVNGRWYPLSGHDDVYYKEGGGYLWKGYSGSYSYWAIGANVGDWSWGFRWGGNVFDCCDNWWGYCEPWYYYASGYVPSYAVAVTESCYSSTDAFSPMTGSANYLIADNIDDAGVPPHFPEVVSATDSASGSGSVDIYVMLIGALIGAAVIVGVCIFVVRRRKATKSGVEDRAHAVHVPDASAVSMDVLDAVVEPEVTSRSTDGGNALPGV